MQTSNTFPVSFSLHCGTPSSILWGSIQKNYLLVKLVLLPTCKNFLLMFILSYISNWIELDRLLVSWWRWFVLEIETQFFFKINLKFLNLEFTCALVFIELLPALSKYMFSFRRTINESSNTIHLLKKLLYCTNHFSWFRKKYHWAFLNGPE